MRASALQALRIRTCSLDEPVLIGGPERMTYSMNDRPKEGSAGFSVCRCLNNTKVCFGEVRSE